MCLVHYPFTVTEKDSNYLGRIRGFVGPCEGILYEMKGDLKIVKHAKEGVRDQSK